MPREERFGIGKKIDELLLALLDTLRQATYETVAKKTETLGIALVRVDAVRFFLQLAWEARLIETKHYTHIAETIEEIGKMVGGWRRGLIAKTEPSV
jgi:hypothetical protein